MAHISSELTPIERSSTPNWHLDSFLFDRWITALNHMDIHTLEITMETDVEIVSRTNCISSAQGKSTKISE